MSVEFTEWPFHPSTFLYMDNAYNEKLCIQIIMLYIKIVSIYLIPKCSQTIVLWVLIAFSLFFYRICQDHDDDIDGLYIQFLGSIARRHKNIVALLQLYTINVSSRTEPILSEFAMCAIEGNIWMLLYIYIRCSWLIALQLLKRSLRTSSYEYWYSYTVKWIMACLYCYNNELQYSHIIIVCAYYCFEYSF